jgi:RNA polymerase sigma factor (sigma-70 family)
MILEFGAATIFMGAPGLETLPAVSFGERRRCRERHREAIEDPTDPEQMFQKKNRADILRRYLAELSVEHREIVDLVYYHERSVEEAATILGIPKNTVKTACGRRDGELEPT